jgi:hypothetical protein
MVEIHMVLLICVYAHALQKVQHGICNLNLDECAGENKDSRRNFYLHKQMLRQSVYYMVTSKIVPNS